MKNNRTLITLSIIAIIITSAIMLKKSLNRSQSGKKWTIAILQTASHPALDAARDGFMTTLQQKLGDDIGFVVRNGEGSIGAIHTIAQQFNARNDINAIYAIATPAAQAAVSLEKEKPVIIAAVTVAPELGIDFAYPNVCGVSDMINVRSEIEAMHQLLPNISTVGIIFNTAEVNSVAVSKVMVTELERVGYTPVTIGIASESDIEPAVMSALRKVDALIAPTDHSVANAIALIADLARKAEKPLVISDNMLIKYGPLMARGVDYYKSGTQAAQVALELLVNHKKPYELPIMGAESKQVFINKQTLALLKLTIPETLAPDMVMVETVE